MCNVLELVRLPVIQNISRAYVALTLCLRVTYSWNLFACEGGIKVSDLFMQLTVNFSTAWMNFTSFWVFMEGI